MTFLGILQLADSGRGSKPERRPTDDGRRSRERLRPPSPHSYRDRRACQCNSRPAEPTLMTASRVWFAAFPSQRMLRLYSSCRRKTRLCVALAIATLSRALFTAARASTRARSISAGVSGLTVPLCSRTRMLKQAGGGLLFGRPPAVRRGEDGHERIGTRMRRLPPLLALAALALSAAPTAASSTAIKASTTRGAAPLQVTLTASGGGVSYHWHLGDGTIAEGETVLHTYESAGAYRATVTGIGLDGRRSTAALTISVANAKHGSSALLLAILLALAGLLALALAILVVRYRRRPTAAASRGPATTPEPARAPAPARARRAPLERALGELEDALADGQVDQQRRALELLASELGESGEDGLAGEARELAWSRGSLDRDNVLAFAHAVRRTVDEGTASARPRTE